MQSPDLSKIKVRCGCGERIQLRTWYEEQYRSHVLVMGVHGRQFAQRIDDLVHSPSYDQFYASAIREGQRALRKECWVSLPIAELGKVVDTGYTGIEYTTHEGKREITYVRTPARPVNSYQQPSPRPCSTSAFGRPVARKIITSK
jgi:hypothetical protein